MESIEKLCYKCNIYQSLDNFHKNKTKKDGLNNTCKTCSKIYKKDYNSKNKIKIAIYNEQYRNSHSEEIILYKKETRQQTKIYNKEYKKERMENDLNFKIASRLRTRLYNAIQIGQKTGSAVNDLGCSIKYFVNEYIPSLFQFGMSWDNYGDWHLDHIIPLSSFDLTIRKQFLKASYYTNYQPLWAIDNLRKNNKIMGL